MKTYLPRTLFLFTDVEGKSDVGIVIYNKVNNCVIHYPSSGHSYLISNERLDILFRETKHFKLLVKK